MAARNRPLTATLGDIIGNADRRRIIHPPALRAPAATPRRAGDQFTMVETVTPERARQLLEANTTEQRPISIPIVDMFARDMVEGNWRLTHQGIAISRDGQLLDGQHRLTAIVRANVAVQLVVTYNVEPDAFRAIDSGLTRTALQVLTIDARRGGGEFKYASQIISGAKLLWRLHEDHEHSTARYSHQETAELVARYRKPLDWAASYLCSSSARPLRLAQVIGPFGYAWEVAPDVIETFVREVISRVSMTQTAVALWRAVERLGPAMRDQHSRSELTHSVFRCLQARNQGELISRAYRRSDQTLAYDYWRGLREQRGLVT